jgi:hypothetical protein
LSQNRTRTEPSRITAVDLAGAWLLNSGIQEPNGGVARYYVADTHESRAISTEITGYAISALLYLYSLTHEERYLAAASGAGRFLRFAWDSRLGIFPFEYAGGETGGEGLAYFFDSGIIVRGLVRLWRATAGSEWIEAAKACGRSMRQDFAAGDSEYHPILRLPAKEPSPRSPQWSRMPGCYQLKAALGWLDLHKETGASEYLDWYEELLAASLRTQESFLPGASGEGVMDRLHAYCYFLEGILPRVERPEVARALADGIDRVAALMGAMGPQFVRSDVCAQLLRLQLLADRAGVGSIDRLAALSLVEKIQSFQLSNVDLRIHGGFFFARRGDRLQPHVNPVSTAFGLQAILMWRQYLAGELLFSPDTLI